jgi:hypothetical protein
MNMRTNDGKKGLRLSQSALSEMKARLALLNTAISALQRYQGHSDEGLQDDSGDQALAAGVRPKPFLVARRDRTRTEKAS